MRSSPTMKSLSQSRTYYPNTSLSTGQALMWTVGGVMLMFLVISLLFVVKLGSEGRLPFLQKRSGQQAAVKPDNNTQKPPAPAVAPPVSANSTEGVVVDASSDPQRPESKANFVAGAESVLPADIAQLSKEDPSSQKAPPSTPAPAAGTPQPTEHAQATTEDVARHIEAWVRDWESKDVSAYLAHYASDFRPANQLGYNAWLQQRKERLARPGPISIEISSPDITIKGARATARFVQNYTGGGQRLSEIKALELVHSEQRWLIVAERIGQ